MRTTLFVPNLIRLVLMILALVCLVGLEWISMRIGLKVLRVGDWRSLLAFLVLFCMIGFGRVFVMVALRAKGIIEATFAARN